MTSIPSADNPDESGGPGEPGADGNWVERVVERSEQVQRTRTKSIEQARLIVDAAIRLIPKQGASFTTQELTQEAGVAVQTFYRSFESKDSLLLAVFEELIGEFSQRYAETLTQNPDPVARLRDSVTAAIGSWRSNPEVAQFMTAQHWRLFQLYPTEVAAATSQFSRLIQQDLEEAGAKGLLEPRNPEYDAWLITQLVMAIFHNSAFAQPAEDAEEEAERLWAFCWAALGGTPR